MRMEVAGKTKKQLGGGGGRLKKQKKLTTTFGSPKKKSFRFGSALVQLFCTQPCSSNPYARPHASHNAQPYHIIIRG